MKNRFSKKMMTALMLVLAIFMSIVPITAFADTSETVPHDEVGCCEFSMESNNSLESEISLPQVNDEVLHIESSKAEIIASIKSSSEFSVKGTVEKEGKQTNANEYFDFSIASKFDIAKWAFKNNLISEVEKIDCYCDLYINRNFENLFCLTEVIEEISEYRDNTFLTEEMSHKINAIFERPFSDEEKSDNTSQSRSKPDLSNEANYSSDHFKIYYDSSKVLRSTAQNVASCFEELYTIFINAGYNKPKLEILRTTYQVYLDPNEKNGQSTIAGTCFSNSSLTNTCSSYIVLYKFGSSQTVDQNMEEIICHEYFHAIQKAYNSNVNWFTEACAEWAVINYVQRSYTIDWKVESFLNESNLLTDENYKYGTVLYPLTIQRAYGGVNTIRSIWECYNDYSSSLTDAQFRTMVTEGIQAAGYSGTFISSYRLMTAYNCCPSFWYSNIYPNNTFLPDGNFLYFPINSSSNNTRSYTLQPLESDCYELQLPLNFTGEITINVTFSGTGNMQLYYKESNAQSVEICSPTSNSQTVYTIENCEDYLKIRIIISNTGSSSTNYIVTVTPG